MSLLGYRGRKCSGTGNSYGSLKAVTAGGKESTSHIADGFISELTKYPLVWHLVEISRQLQKMVYPLDSEESHDHSSKLSAQNHRRLGETRSGTNKEHSDSADHFCLHHSSQSHEDDSTSTVY